MSPAPPQPERFAQDAATVGVTLNAAQLAQLDEFVFLLHKWNKAFNLVSRRDVERLWVRHILDSLSVHSLLRGDRIMDIGSGGGFPAIPLAIGDTARSFTLVERQQRKCRFLEQLGAQLGLANTTVQCDDVRGLRLSEDGGYSTIISRATTSVDELWSWSRPLLAADGRLVAMTSTRGGTSVLPAGACARSVHVPGLEQAHEVVIMDCSRIDG